MQLIITVLKKVMFSAALVSVLVCLFVCYQDYTKIVHSVVTKFDGKGAHAPPMKALDFDDNPH